MAARSSSGGYSSGGYLASAELYERGPGFQSTWRATLTTATSALVLRLQVGGSGLRGYGLAKASGGSTRGWATNYPLVQLRRRTVARCAGCARTQRPASPPLPSSHSRSRTSCPALVTVFANGIPGRSKVIVVVKLNRLYLLLVLR